MTAETKYNVADSVFVLFNNKVCNTTVQRIEISAYGVGKPAILYQKFCKTTGCYYKVEYFCNIGDQTDVRFPESDLFLFKKELLATL